MPSNVTFPDDKTIVLERVYAAPCQAVWDALFSPDVVAPFDETDVKSESDRRVGGKWYNSFVAPDGTLCEFFGEFLEFEEPVVSSETWHFGGWPDVEAVQTTKLEALTADSTRLTCTTAFRTADERAYMTSTDGLEANFEKVALVLDVE